MHTPTLSHEPPKSLAHPLESLETALGSTRRHLADAGSLSSTLNEQDRRFTGHFGDAAVQAARRLAMDRRREDGAATPTQDLADIDVFGDDFAVDGFDVVVDGFRPEVDRESHSHTPDPPIRTASACYAANPAVTRIMPSRNSTRKSPSFANPFASAEDEVDVPLNRTASMRSQSTASYAPGIARRSISSASSQHFARSHSPVMGVAGPSHPYGMYPQGTIARTASVATSTAPGGTHPSSPFGNGPQHPYGMYHQGVGEDVDSEDDEDGEDSRNPVPVGFPGLGQTYRRVRGPEGEEQDIIGADGHTEQLPPYTRYPDDGPAKVPLLAVPPTLHSRGPVQGSDPGMPLMHQHTAPQSMTDASNLHIEQSESLLPQTENRSPSEESSIANKPWKEKSWKEKRRTRICGIRLSWILVGLAILGFIFAVIVGVIVGYISGTRHSRNQSSLPTPSLSLYDASIIATPTNKPTTGTFALALNTAEATQAECLTNPTQRPAWDCNLVGKPAVAMSVGAQVGPTPTPGAFLFYASESAAISYGAQYQFLETAFSPFLPVQDNDDPNFGPAFYFGQRYDKIVVVPEHVFTRTKRGWNVPQAFRQEKQLSQPGEKPWFCFFNDTYLETFIYVQKPVNISKTLSSTSSPAVTSASSTNFAPPWSWNARFTTTAPANAAATTSPSTTSTSTSARSSSYNYGGEQSHPPSMLKPRNADTYDSLNMYPYMVKIEERRLSNTTKQPYCQQFQILDNMQYNWVADANGQPIKFTLAETAPGYEAYLNAGGADISKTKREKVSGGCHCQWMHGQP